MRVDGCLNVALVQRVSGLWHEAHAVPKWLAGGLWHEMQSADEGCDAAQEAPAFLWHVAHETVRVCPDGGVWHEAQAEEVWR